MKAFVASILRFGRGQSGYFVRSPNRSNAAVLMYGIQGDFRLTAAALAILSGSFITANNFILNKLSHSEEKDKPVLILLSGKRNAGKDYALKLLQREAAFMKSERVAFADAAKEDFAALKGLDVNLLKHDREYKEKVRKEMTAWYFSKVDQDPTYFIRIAAEKAVAAASDKDFVAVSDWRFPEEIEQMERIAKAHFRRIVKVRVEATDESRARFGWQASEVDQSATETSLDNYEGFDIVIHNDGSTEDLIRAIRRQLMTVAFPTSTLAGFKAQHRNYTKFKSVYFNDVMATYNDVGATQFSNDCFEAQIRSLSPQVTHIVGADSRGYIMAAMLAERMKLPLVLARKGGSQPPPFAEEEIKTKNYGAGSHAVSRLALGPGDVAVVFDDVLATGGSVEAIAKAVEACGATVASIMVICDFTPKKGIENLKGRDVYSIYAWPAQPEQVPWVADA